MCVAYGLPNDMVQDMIRCLHLNICKTKTVGNVKAVNQVFQITSIVEKCNDISVRLPKTHYSTRMCNKTDFKFAALCIWNLQLHTCVQTPHACHVIIFNCIKLESSEASGKAKHRTVYAVRNGKDRSVVGDGIYHLSAMQTV
ncbi:unnamed protein product [Ostreobium quekettii]|uniref:Uncharacterized protein n=1 Tax=Ostreobium quekettii TaxID=121088 RepID=A0A8S1J7G8_9CHLO|nr:unnamed protein product [Ostreobium quekettii]